MRYISEVQIHFHTRPLLAASYMGQLQICPMVKKNPNLY